MAREFTVVANLLADPEVRDANGKDVINLDFRENLGYFDKDREWVETGQVDYTAALWEGGFQAALFDNVADSLHSGDKIVAVVRFRGEGIQTFERKNGDLGGKLEVDIIEIGASLKNATVEVTRNKKKSRRDEDEDEKPKRSSSRSRAKDDDEDADDTPKRSRSKSKSDDNDDDEDEKPARRGGGRASSGRSRSSSRSKGSDDAF